MTWGVAPGWFVGAFQAKLGWIAAGEVWVFAAGGFVRGVVRGGLVEWWLCRPVGALFYGGAFDLGRCPRLVCWRLSGEVWVFAAGEVVFILGRFGGC